MGVIKELRPDTLPLLREILESQMPNSLTVHGFVDSLIRYNLKELGTKVFVATEASFSTFLVLTPTATWEGMQSITVYFKEELHSDDEKGDEDGLADEEFEDLLKSVPGLDWTKPVYFYGLNQYVLTKIRRLMNSGRLMADASSHGVCQAHAYVLPPEDDEALQEIRLVEGYTLGRLAPAHADWVHGHWPYKQTETKDLFYEIISKLPSIAAFEASSAENDLACLNDLLPQSPPVSWILRYPDGSIGSTFTVPEHRRRGLARQVTLALSRKVAALYPPVFVYVDDTNTASVEFHKKMGFLRACPFAWEVYLPSGLSLEEAASGEDRVTMGALREIPRESLPQLKRSLEAHLPAALVVHGCVDWLVRQDLRGLESRIFVAPEDSTFSSLVAVTPACTWKGVQSITLYYKDEEPHVSESGGEADFAREKSDKELATLLKSVPVLNWSKPVFLYACPKHVLLRVRWLLSSGLLNEDLKYHSISQGNAYILQPEDIHLQEVRLADGYTLGSLGPAEADWVHTNWPYNFSETKQSLRALVSQLPSAAAFENDYTDSKMDENNPRNFQPVSWILTYKYGALGLTHTMTEHRRLGLAKDLTLALAKKVDAQGAPVYVIVDDRNKPSITLHTQMGFQEVGPFGWDLYLPSGISLEAVKSQR